MSPVARAPDALFDTLNPEQRQAAAHGLGDATAPALRIVAGAGTGKTLTLAARVAALVRAGADPQRLLLLSFSRRAAQMLAQRSGRLLHQAMGYPATLPPPALPWAGTFHAVGARLLRDHAAEVGLSADFTLLDRADAEDLMGQVRQAQGLAATAARFPTAGTCLAIYSRAVNSQAPLADLLRDHFPWCAPWAAELRGLFTAYLAEKQAQHVLDYDDLLLYWHDLMAEPALAARVRRRFDQVLVDEYQDTNRLQSAILRALCPHGCGLTVVGDDAQAIYAFRAAEVHNLLDFPAQFTPPAHTVALTRNYRATAPLLAASNAVIALATEGFPKTLWTDLPGERPRLVTADDDAAQARWVADEALRRREEGLVLKQQAVLFRTGHHSAALELELTRRNIPFVKFGGLKFLEAAHVKDLLAVLRWVQNPSGRLAAGRVASRVPGLGPAGVRRLLDALAAAGDPVQAMHDFRPPPSAAEGWAAWRAAFAEMQDTPWPAQAALALDWYRPQLERLHADAAVRLPDLQQLLRLAATQPTRERFLAELTLDPPEATSDESGPPLRDEDYLILSTLHSAKGQEWTAVTILNVVDGCLPSDLSTGRAAEIEEERRLLYVGMTRARRHLALMVPLRFHVTQQARGGDRHLYGGRTRFIPDALLPLFDAVTAGAPADGAPDDASGGSASPPGPGVGGPSIDLPARVRQRFA